MSNTVADQRKKAGEKASDISQEGINQLCSKVDLNYCR